MNQDTGIVALCYKIGNCIIINFCWLIACLPIVTIGAASTALYATVRRVILYDDGKPTKTFFKEFKICFRMATIAWLILAAITAIFVAIAWWATNASFANADMIRIAMVIVVSIMILLILHAFAYMARFPRDLVKTLRSSLVIMLEHPIWDLLIFALFVVMAIIIFHQIWLIVVLPAILMIPFVKFMDNVFYRLMSEEEREREEEYRNEI